MNLLFAASGLESLITLLVFIGIAVVSNWLKKRQQPEDETESWPGQETGHPPPSVPGSPSPRPQAPRPAKTAGWEEELRRLLEGDEPAAQPPPVIVYQAPRPVAKPAPLPPSVPRPAPVVFRGTDEDMDKGLPVRMPSLNQSEQAYQKASRLQVSTAEHFREISDKVAAHAAVQQVKRLPIGPHPAIALLRNHSSLQSAIVVSVLLGPPKALDSQF